MVKGDLIIPESNRIMTRSAAKKSTFYLAVTKSYHANRHQDPDQFTIIPASLKIIKVLIEELLSASGIQSAANQMAAAEFADEEGDDDGWEDVPSVLDLGLGTTKADLMAYVYSRDSFGAANVPIEALLTEILY